MCLQGANGPTHHDHHIHQHGHRPHIPLHDFRGEIGTTSHAVEGALTGTQEMLITGNLAMTIGHGGTGLGHPIGHPLGTTVAHPTMADSVRFRGLRNLTTPIDNALGLETDPEKDPEKGTTNEDTTMIDITGHRAVMNGGMTLIDLQLRLLHLIRILYLHHLPQQHSRPSVLRNPFLLDHHHHQKRPLLPRHQTRA